MVVLNPVKLVITNYPEGKTEEFEVENNPNDPDDGTRTVTFSRECWIEADDFLEEKVKGYNRFYPGNEVRLKSAYIVKCTGCKKDDSGKVVEVYAEYDPLTRGGDTPDGRKVRGTVHWVDAADASDCEVRLYENLEPDVGEKNFLDYINPQSLTILTDCKAERSLAQSAAAGDLSARYQFLRLGYFCIDKDSTADNLIFNRSVSLKDGFKKK